MTNVTRCECCFGRKTIRGLGNIQKTCDACRGIGWINEPEKELENVLHGTLEATKERRKPGRKPKMINKELALNV